MLLSLADLRDLSRYRLCCALAHLVRREQARTRARADQAPPGRVRPAPRRPQGQVAGERQTRHRQHVARSGGPVPRPHPHRSGHAARPSGSGRLSLSAVDSSRPCLAVGIGAVLHPAFPLRPAVPRALDRPTLRDWSAPSAHQAQHRRRRQQFIDAIPRCDRSHRARRPIRPAGDQSLVRRPARNCPTMSAALFQEITGSIKLGKTLEKPCWRLGARSTVPNSASSSSALPSSARPAAISPRPAKSRQG